MKSFLCRNIQSTCLRPLPDEQVAGEASSLINAVSPSYIVLDRKEVGRPDCAPRLSELSASCAEQEAMHAERLPRSTSSRSLQRSGLHSEAQPDLVPGKQYGFGPLAL